MPNEPTPSSSAMPSRWISTSPRKIRLPASPAGGRPSSVLAGRSIPTGSLSSVPTSSAAACAAPACAVARMCAHITYLSEEALSRKFGRRLQNAPKDNTEAISLFGEMFEVESYLRHQGSTFVQRFDANSYLTITRAMDYFDLAADCGGDLANAFRGTKTRFLLVSFTSDWLFPTAESRAIARTLNSAVANVSFVEIPTDKGPDA